MNMTRNLCPQYFMHHLKVLKMMKNGLNNSFTAHLIRKLSGILYFCVMTSQVVPDGSKEKNV